MTQPYQSDNHVTKLTIKPNSSTGYWQGFTTISAVMKALFADVISKNAGYQNPLLLIYAYSSVSINIEYDDTTLLDGTLTINYPTKTATTPTTYSLNSNYIAYIENNTHTGKYDFTLYPQVSSKNYDVRFELDRSVEQTGTNSTSSSSAMKLYRQTTSGSTSTIADASAALNMTMQDGATQPTASSLASMNLNLADKIRITESSPLNTMRVIELYRTAGESISDAELASNASEINNLLSNAGVALYLNKNTSKAGDIRATVGDINQTYKHVRLGIQFNGSNEVELVKDIANPDDLQQVKTLVGLVSTQAQELGQLITTLNLTGLADNEIIRLIFRDLFGTI